MKKAIRNLGLFICLSLVAGCGSAQTVSLTGNGVQPTVPGLSVNAATIPFGSVDVGATATQTLQLTSSGTASVIVSAITLTGPEFTASNIQLPLTLPPAATANLSVTFAPTTAGAATGSITIVSNAKTSPVQSVILSAAAVTQSYEVNLTWLAPASSPDPIVTYSIYRSAHGTAIFASLGTVPVGATAYTDSTVSQNTSYDYMIESVDANGVSSAPSNVSTAVIP